MSSCPTCGNRDYLCQQCKMEELENRLGLPEDHFDADAGIVCWVQDLNGNWHASMYFEGTRHAAACGELLETPVADVRDDPRRLADTHTCDDCEAALEADEGETVPDGGEFATANELRADGGEVDVYQWVLENVHEYPAGTDSRWGSRGNLVHQGRKLDGVEKDDVQAAIARAVDNEDLISWHGLLALAEIDRLREIVRVEHEEHDITRQILVGKCNKLIATKKQEQADEAEPEVATDGGVDQSSSATCQFSASVSADSHSSIMLGKGVNSVPPQEPHPSRLPIGWRPLFGKSTAAYTAPHSLQAATRRLSFSISLISGFISKKHIQSTVGGTRLLVTAVTTEECTLYTEGDQQ